MFDNVAFKVYRYSTSDLVTKQVETPSKFLPVKSVQLEYPVVSSDLGVKLKSFAAGVVIIPSSPNKLISAIR